MGIPADHDLVPAPSMYLDIRARGGVPPQDDDDDDDDDDDAIRQEQPTLDDQPIYQPSDVLKALNIVKVSLLRKDPIALVQEIGPLIPTFQRDVKTALKGYMAKGVPKNMSKPVNQASSETGKVMANLLADLNALYDKMVLLGTRLSAQSHRKKQDMLKDRFKDQENQIKLDAKKALDDIKKQRLLLN